MSPVDASLDVPPVPQRRNSHNRSASLPTASVLGGMNSADSTPNLSDMASPTIPSLPAEYPNLANDTQISSPLSVISYRSLVSEESQEPTTAKPVLPAISTSDPFSFPTQFLSPAEIGYAMSTSPTSPLDAEGDRRSSGGWWDVVSAVDSDSKPPWQRSNNSLSLSALGSSPAKSQEAGTAMVRGASGDSYHPPASPSAFASAMLPPGAAPAVVTPTAMTRSTSHMSHLARVEESMEGFAPMQLVDGDGMGSPVLSTVGPTSTVTDHTPRMPGSPPAQYDRSPPVSPVDSPSMASVSSFTYDQPDYPSVNSHNALNRLANTGGQATPPYTPETSPRIRPPPVPIMMNRPNFPSPSSERVPSVSGGPSTPNGQTGTSPVKGISKLASFGRTMSIARVRKKDRERSGSVDLGKEQGSGQGRKGEKQSQSQTSSPMNDPGRWNRDMVASIMGQPAERR